MNLRQPIALAVIAALMYLTGCDQQTDIPDPATAAVLAVQDLDAPTERKLAYRLLSDREKDELWSTRLREIASFDGLTPSQRSLVRELESFFATYDGWGQELVGHRLERVNAFEDQWVRRAMDVFSGEQIYAIAYDIQAASNLTDDITVRLPESLTVSASDSGGTVSDASRLFSSEVVQNGSRECICRVGSAWTCPYNKCTVGVPSNCTVEYGVCSRKLGDCTDDTPGGCGFGLLSRCDGDTCNRDGDRGPTSGGPGSGDDPPDEGPCFYNPGLPGCERNPVVAQ